MTIETRSYQPAVRPFARIPNICTNCGVETAPEGSTRGPKCQEDERIRRAGGDR